MTMVFVNKPHRENRPVVISNTKQAETAISRSTASKAVPIFIEVYFFRIMATMSVPPLEAPMLNMIAELMPEWQWQKSVPEPAGQSAVRT